MRLRQQTGQNGEAIAARYLLARGFSIIERNWRPGKGLRGEIDLIAEQNQVLCFVEVKTRTSNELGTPGEAVHEAKQRQIARLAMAYLALHDAHERSCRFDVVEVWLAPDGRSLPRVHLIEAAFEAPGSSHF